MVFIDEDFLLKNNSKFSVNYALPLRIQKRSLLQALGFPSNKNMNSCLANNCSLVENLFEDYCNKGYPFLIIVSEKPMFTLIPPLFIVYKKDEILWRNDQGVKKTITFKETIEEIAKFKPFTWLEFSKYLWVKRNAGGRLLYINKEEQIFEVQQGTIPSQLINNLEYPVYAGKVSDLKFNAKEYFKNANHLLNLGYKHIIPIEAVELLLEVMHSYKEGFNELVKISPKPTFEFAFVNNKLLISIDIDWPAQWKE